MTPPRSHSPLQPKRGKRRVRKVIHVLTEGESERDYLAMDAIRSAIQSGGYAALKMVKGHKGQTDPASLVKQMKAHLRRQDFRSDDEAWIVIDIDEWTDKQVAAAIQWESGDDRHHLVISKPKFELFLLMHFCDAFDCATPSEVDSRLKRYWPEYQKRISRGKFSLDQIQKAVYRSQRCDRVDLIGDASKSGTEMGGLISRLITPSHRG